MARRYSVKERQAYCAKWRTSGLSKIKFCAEEKISESALHKWLKLYGSTPQSEEKEGEIKFIKPELASSVETRIIDILLPNVVMIKTEVKSVAEMIRELLI
jgi:hypothetical protein